MNDFQRFIEDIDIELWTISPCLEGSTELRIMYYFMLNVWSRNGY